MTGRRQRVPCREPAVKSESTSVKVVRNTLFNYLAVGSAVLVNLVALPVIIHGLGNARYGIYVTTMSVIGYVALLDLGIGTSLTKFVAEYEAKKDYRRLNEVFSTAFVLYIGLGTVGAAILVALCDTLIQRVFEIPPELWSEARYVVWISALSLLSGLTLGIYGNILNGIQRHDIWRTISIATSFVSALGGIILIRMGYRLIAYVLFTTIAGIAGFLVQMFYAKRLVPDLDLLPRFFRVRELKDILGFTSAIFINQLAARNMGSLDKVIVGIFLPIQNVTLYSIAVTMVMYCFKLPAAAAMAFTPAASELHAKNRIDAIHRLVLRGIKYTGILALPIFTLVGIMAGDIVRLWMGEGYGASADILRRLMIGYFPLVLCASGMTVMVGIGKPYVNTLYALVQIVLCSTLTVLMIHWYGLLGAALGSGLALCAGGIVYLFHSSRIFGIAPSRLLDPLILKKGALALVPTALLFAVHSSMPSHTVRTLLAEATLYCLVFVVVVTRYVIDEYDIAKISEVVAPFRYVSLLRPRPEAMNRKRR